MKFFKRKNSKLFLKYFFSFAALMMLLVLILGFCFNTLILNKFSDIFQEQHTKTLISQIDIITNNLTSIENTAYLIESIPINIPFLVQSEPIYTRNFQQYLTSLAAINPMIKSIAVVYKNYPDSVVSSAGTMPFDLFVDNYLSKNHIPESFRIDLDESITPKIFLTENEFNFIIPIPLGQDKNYGWVIFVLKSSMLTDVIEKNLSEYNFYIDIIDTSATDNHYAIGNTNYTDDNSLHETELTPKTHPDKFIITTEEFFGNFTYTVSVLKEDVFSQIDFLGIISLLTIFFIGLLSLLFAYFISCAIYNPIRKISHSVDNNFSSSNELEFISNSIKEFVSLRESTLDIQENIENQLYKNLLLTSDESSERIEKIIKFTKLKFEKPFFSVLCVNYLKQNAVDDFKINFIEFLQSSLNVELLFDGILHDKVVCIINHEYDNLIELKSFINEFFIVRTDTSIYISIGSNVDNITKLSKSYKDALFISGYSFFKTDKHVIINDDIYMQLETNYCYPKHEEKKLIAYILLGNLEKSLQYANKLLDIMIKEQLQIKVYKGILISVLNNIKNSIEAQNYNSDSIFQRVKLFMINNHTENTILFNDFMEIITDTVNLSKNVISSTDTNIINEISSFVHANISNYNLSLNSVADHIHMSQSYITKIHREQTGYTIKEFIDHVKIENSKQLLLDKNSTILSIATANGFLDINSFCRKFKSMEGITPMQYRNLHL